MGRLIVFAPTPEVIYPSGQPAVRIDPGPIATVLEGRTRPTHFAGVCQVVLTLMHLTAPRWALFGRKDVQQLAIIEAMVRDLAVPLEIVPVDIRRESDGLAMSSRNAYLSPEQRRQALALSRALRAGHDAAAQTSGARPDPAAIRRGHFGGFVADEGAAVGVEAAGVDANQRVVVDGADEFHRAETVVDFSGDVCGDAVAQSDKCRGFAAVDGDDAVSDVVSERQKGKGAAVEEAFARGVIVCVFVFEAEDEDVAPEFVGVGGDAHRAADEGKAAVGSNQQLAADGVSVIESDVGATGIVAAGDDAALGMPTNIGLILHGFIGAATDDVVRHEVAEGIDRSFMAVRRRQREVQAVRRVAV